MIALDGWKASLNTFNDPSQIAPNELQIATNVITEDDNLAPLQALGSLVATNIPPGSTYKWIYRLGNNWQYNTNRVFACEWQGSKLAYQVEGGGGPKWTDGTTTASLGLAGAGVGVALTATDSTNAGNVTGAVQYVVTFVSANGQESAPSDVSGAVTVSAKIVALTVIPVSTDPSVTGRNIYRTNNGVYQRLTAGVTIADNTTATYSDNVAAINLFDALLTTNGGAAPSGSWMGFSPYQACVFLGTGQKVYFSNQGAPTNWPATNFVTLPENGVCGASAGNAFLVLTARRPHLIIGRDPTSFALQTRNETYGTNAPFSLVTTDIGLLYWSPQGLVRYGGGVFDLLTRDKLSKPDVAALEANSGTMHAAYRRGEYLLFHSGGCLIVNLRYGDVRITKSDQTCDAVQTFGDTVYLGIVDQVYPWATGGAGRSMAVRTAEISQGAHIGHWRLHALDMIGTVTVTHYVDGVSVGSEVLTSPNAGASRGIVFTFVPWGHNWGNRYSIDTTGTGTVYRMELNTEREPAIA